MKDHEIKVGESYVRLCTPHLGEFRVGWRHETLVCCGVRTQKTPAGDRPWFSMRDASGSITEFRARDILRAAD